MKYGKLLISCCLLLAFNFSFAQKPGKALPVYDSLRKIYPDTNTLIKVVAINLHGNRKTKGYIIMREVPFSKGDNISIGILESIMEQTRRNVFNTSLFSEVSVVPVVIAPQEINIEITVLEKWYIYPTPQFQFADRNINEWLKTYHADFNRVIYGVKFTHYNFTGRSDQLRIYLLNGYSRAVSFGYNAPFGNTKLNEGFRISGGYSQNRELPYKTTRDNALLQYKKEGFVRNNWFVSLSYQSRKGFFTRRIYTLSYNYMNVDDSVVSQKYNPGYFGGTKSAVGFPELSYVWQYGNVDHVNYPLEGTVLGFGILKRGFGFKGGVNMLSFDVAAVKYMSHFNRRLFSSVQFYARVKVPEEQAYINQRALGYGELYLRGHEYYVIDGTMAALAKFTVKKKLLSFKIPVPLRIRQLPNIPFTFFAKAYGDLGYCYNKSYESRLNNVLLYTGGFGIDILSVYGFTLNLEYSFDQLGKNGLFLHGRSGF